MSNKAEEIYTRTKYLESVRITEMYLSKNFLINPQSIGNDETQQTIYHLDWGLLIIPNAPFSVDMKASLRHTTGRPTMDGLLAELITHEGGKTTNM